MSSPLAAVRAIHIAATLLASGTVLFRVLAAAPAFRVARQSEQQDRFRRRCNRLIWWALAAAVISGGIWLVLVAAAILDVPLLGAVSHGGILLVTEETLFGWMWTVRLVLALALALLLLWPAGRWLQVAVACTFAALIAFSGHGAATPGMAGNIHLAADMVHLIAAAAWVGALPALAWLIITMLHEGDSIRRFIALNATKRFSWTGMVCVAALLATGIINSLYMLTSPDDLIDTSYGRILSIKIVLFAVMVAIATINRFSITPRLPKPRAMRALARNSILETALGFGVVVAVAVLGIMEPGGHSHHFETAIPNGTALVYPRTLRHGLRGIIEAGHVAHRRLAFRAKILPNSRFMALRSPSKDSATKSDDTLNMMG